MLYFKYLNKNHLFSTLARLKSGLASSFDFKFSRALLLSLTLSVLFCLLPTCGAQGEKPGLDQLGDQNLQGYAWEGWARIDTCYYCEPSNMCTLDDIIVYRTCPEELVDAQKHLIDRKYNARLNVEAGGASTLSFSLAYAFDNIPEYLINLPGYSRSADYYVHENVPIQILTFDVSGATVSSGDITDFNNMKLEQQAEFLSGSMMLRLLDYQTIEVPTISPLNTIVMQSFDLYFIFSLLLNKTEK